LSSVLPGKFWDKKTTNRIPPPPSQFIAHNRHPFRCYVTNAIEKPSLNKIINQANATTFHQFKSRHVIYFTEKFSKIRNG
jgi:hypothetical protein